MSWNRKHRRSCKSVEALEERFRKEGICNLKREMFGCLYIKMPNRKYMIQVFNEKNTSGLICDCGSDIKILMNMNTDDIVGFVMSFDRLMPRIEEVVKLAIFKTRQIKYADKIAFSAFPAIMNSLLTDKEIRFKILDIRNGMMKVILSPTRSDKFHLRVEVPVENMKEHMQRIITALEILLSEMNEDKVEINLINYQYPCQI